MFDDDALENLKIPPERRSRVPTGRYPTLMPTLRHLIVHHGVSVRAAARIFGLKATTLSMRLSETDAFIERELRDFELARHALVEEIARGTLPAAEFWDHLTEHWQEDLLERGITPQSGQSSPSEGPDEG